MSADGRGNYLGADDALDDWDGRDDDRCTWCDGEPWTQECSNPLECGCDRRGHCEACGDTGLAKNQVVW